MSNHVDGKDKTIPAPAVNLSIKTRAHISQTYKTNDTMIGDIKFHLQLHFYPKE